MEKLVEYVVELIIGNESWLIKLIQFGDVLCVVQLVKVVIVVVDEDKKVQLVIQELLKEKRKEVIEKFVIWSFCLLMILFLLV